MSSNHKKSTRQSRFRLLPGPLAHAEAGRVRSARRWLTRTVALDPARVDAHFQLPLAWDKAGKFDRAVPALRRVIALNQASRRAQLPGVQLGRSG
ncbi:MAG: hypothetical protein IPP70_05080 [Elusimicrobia bacterium]|nr:hypothetical protein [Elusimicrobiota bacterium]